ncbi:DUF4443 domain-containing protein [Pyrobaculum islandicum]|nr:DUF4443 domain-containing protein [Pyrobaculum islandicum]
MKRSKEVVYLQMLAVLKNSNTPRGRKNLAEELKIGEGVVRALLEGGRELSHIIVMRGGVKITESGASFLREALSLCRIRDIFVVEEAREVLCGKRCIAYVVDEYVNDVLGLRDDLVRRGACGALIIVEKDGKLKIPPTEDSLERYSIALAKTLGAYSSQGTTFVVVCGETFSDALGLIELKCSKFIS